MTGLIKKYPLLAFFVLAFSFTWIGSLIYYFAIPSNRQILPVALNFPSALIWYYGPFLGAIIVTRISEGKAGLRNLLKRFLIWRVHWRWYAFIVIYPLALHLAVAGIDRLRGGPAPVFFQAEGVPGRNIWITLLGLILFQIFIRGIGEETGWRGFALPHLQNRYSPFKASLVLGILWALWHFHPANFSALLSTGGIFVFINITATTFIFSWLFNHTQGSLLIAALFHMTLNVAEFVVPLGIADASPTRHLIQIGLILIIVILLLFTSKWRLG